MNEPRSYTSPLRQQQMEETHRHIVESALQLIAEHPEEDLTYEAVAHRAGIALRTLQRHFPSRMELMDAMWQESDRRLQLSHYPDTEESMLASVETVFSGMDANASLIRGLMRSNAGQQMRRKDQQRRRKGVESALANATQHLDAAQHARVTGIFHVMFSAPTWEMLRSRAGLQDGEAAKAVRWAMDTLLESLYREQRLALGKSKSILNGTAARKNSKTTSKEKSK